MPRSLTVRAFAKVNVHLQVGRRDPKTGYHGLETLFQTVGLFDTLRVTAARDLRLVGPTGAAPRDGSNLVLRAALALQARARTTKGARIHLTKRIPLAAGLGGGSTDAAATAIALNHVWNTRFTYQQLMQILKPLGADVPFLLRGGAALGTRWGDRLTPVALPVRPCWLVLVTSNHGISTAEAYGRLEQQDKARSIPPGTRGPSARLRALGQAWSQGDWPQPTVNSFERTAFSARPRLKTLVAALRAAGAVQAQLSGSGPTVFGVFGSAGSAREAAAGLALKAGERAFVTRPAPKTPVIMRPNLDKS